MIKTEFMSIEDAFHWAIKWTKEGKEVRIAATDGDSIQLIVEGQL